MEHNERFERLREIVLEDTELQARLRAIADWPAFTSALVAAAGERDIELTPDDIRVEHRRAHLAWLRRWA